MSEIKPCPFCGGNPRKTVDDIFCEHGITYIRTKIECKCGCSKIGISHTDAKIGKDMSVDNFASALFESDKSATEKWNTRKESAE